MTGPTHRIRLTLARKDWYQINRWWFTRHGYKPEKPPADPEQLVERTVDVADEVYRRLRAEQQRRLAENLPRTTFSEIISNLADVTKRSTPAPVSGARRRKRP